MPRKPAITPARPLTVHIPAEVFVRLELFLTSPSLGRVPQGAYQTFLVARILEFFERLERNTAVEAELKASEG